MRTEQKKELLQKKWLHKEEFSAEELVWKHFKELNLTEWPEIVDEGRRLHNLLFNDDIE